MKTVINLRTLKEEGRYTLICLINCQLLKKVCALVAVDVCSWSEVNNIAGLKCCNRSYLCKLAYVTN